MPEEPESSEPESVRSFLVIQTTEELLKAVEAVCEKNGTNLENVMKNFLRMIFLVDEGHKILVTDKDMDEIYLVNMFGEE